MVYHICFHTTRSRRRRPEPPGLYRPSHEITHTASRRHKTCIRTPVRSEYAVAPARHTRRGWEEARPARSPTCHGDLGPYRVRVGIVQCGCGTMHRTHHCED